MKSLSIKSLFLFVLVMSALNSSAQKWGNHTLYATQNGTNAFLVDTLGAVTHSWTFPSTAKTGYSTYLLQGGTLLRTVAKTGNSFNGGPICGEVQKVDWNGNVIWDYVYSTTTYCSHHDICGLPNGNVLLIAYELKTPTEVSAAGCNQSITMWPDKIVEIMPTGPTTGSVVWEWHIWDHLVQNVDPNKANYQSSIVAHPELLNINYNTQKDWMHMNGLGYNPILDQITFSSHNLNEIYVIDHSTTTAEAAGHTGGLSGKGGDLLYRYGNPTAYGATGATVINVVHDAHWVPEGVPNAGYLSGFINRGVSNTQSSVDQITPPLSGYNYTITPGSAYTPSNYTLRHPCNGYTSNQGNAQQLPNGNMLVCMAFLGTVYEINPAGTTIWTKNVAGTLVHAYRYNDCYVNTTAPALPVISESAGVLVSTQGVTYQWYMNGSAISGATSQSYTPTQSGKYLVRITDANGCDYYYSKTYSYNTVDVNTGLLKVSLDQILQVFPNPAKESIQIQLTESGTNGYDVQLFDIAGKLYVSGRNKTEINTEAFPAGLYILSLRTDEGLSVNKKITLIK